MNSIRFWTGCLFVIYLSSSLADSVFGQTIWIEAESSQKQDMHPHGWYGSVQHDQLSQGKFLSNFHSEKGTATYSIEVDTAGEYDFWVRANHVASRLQFRLNGNPWTDIDMSSPQQALNLASDGKPDLRFIAWLNVGNVSLKAGVNELEFQMISPNNNHGSLDCFVLSRDGFVPNGKLRPGEKPEVEAQSGWFVFYPPTDPLDDSSVIDLRFLNQSVAGEDGRVVADGGQFLFADSRQPVRFWAVNGPPHHLKGKALERCARRLAKYGVNLVRVHHRVFTPDGRPDLKNVAHCHEIVRAMKAEGIYVHFSIYFPLWYQPQPGQNDLAGYDGKQNPFAALFFNKAFQQRYQGWLDTLLLTPGPTGQKLVDDPAVFGVELINEDSLFFWTFNQERIPQEQFQLVETQFANWLKKKYGSIDAAYQAWDSSPLEGDRPQIERMTIRPLWNIANQRTPRDQDTATFLAELQYRFYRKFHQHLDGLGFAGLVTCSNWHTASPEYLDPLERLSYTAGDFIDRHGYFSGLHQGEAASYSIRAQHVYTDRSALRFDAAEPGKPKEFNHPAMDLHYNQLPSMISETTFNRPNRYRSEGPLYFAAYGALQDSNAIVHFAYNGDSWAVQSGGINPWTLSTPAMLAQFPAAALIYRQGLVETPSPVATIQMNLDDVKALKGSPLPQGASYDQLRAADLPQGAIRSATGRLDPLLHYVGPSQMLFTDQPTRVQLDPDLNRWIDRAASMVRSAHGQLALNYQQGWLQLDAPRVQGLSGNLRAAGKRQLSDITLQSDSDLQHLVLVSLDDLPIARSRRMLLQVMSEERPTGRVTEEMAPGKFQIQELGGDPWQVREFQGWVKLPEECQVTRLDANGRRQDQTNSTDTIQLDSHTLYYLIER